MISGEKTAESSERDLPAVCFVSMPYAGVERPSMALGLLQGILEADGIASVATYANVWFAEKVGSRLYDVMTRMTPTALAGEWTFAAAAFGKSADRDERYLAYFTTSGHWPASGATKLNGLLDDLWSLRAAATEFADEAARSVLATGARVVGCTSTFEQHVASLAVLRRIRELDSDVITMMGGANCETVMGLATHRCFPWVDYVISGEADELITGLCERILSHGREVDGTDLPPGVLGPCHRRVAPEVTGRTVGLSQALPRAVFRDLDSIPLPQFRDYFATIRASPLRSRIRPGLPLETSRGCWWGDKHQCTFCGLNGSSMAYRSKSPERVLTEIAALEQEHGISRFEVVDNILDMRYFSTLLPRLAEDSRRRSFFYEVKANLTRDQMDLLARAGVRWIQPGIESLHSEVLRLMSKGVQGWQNIQLLKWARQFGIRVSWSVIWGFPGEDDEFYQQMAAWLPLLEHLEAPGAVNLLRYDRYSVYHRQSAELGLILFPIQAMSHVYPVAPADLDDLAYFFTKSPGGDVASAATGETDAPVTRPGVKAVYGAAAQWQASFRSRTRPVLSMIDRDGVLDIIDTRRCATERRRSLKDLDRAVLLACDQAPTLPKLTEAIVAQTARPVGEHEIASVVDWLITENLILPIDNRLVGLAISGVMPPLPTETEFPGGRMIATAS